LEDNNDKYGRKFMALQPPVSKKYKSDSHTVKKIASKSTAMFVKTSLKHYVPQFTVVYSAFYLYNN
jgi:hypothetical protein